VARTIVSQSDLYFIRGRCSHDFVVSPVVEVLVYEYCLSTYICETIKHFASGIFHGKNSSENPPVIMVDAIYRQS
jgi:hypothetical protein